MKKIIGYLVLVAVAASSSFMLSMPEKAEAAEGAVWLTYIADTSIGTTFNSTTTYNASSATSSFILGYKASDDRPQGYNLGPTLDFSSGVLAVVPSSSSTAGSMSAADKVKLDGLVAPVTRTFAYPARTLNNCFQVSSSSDAMVNYSVDIAATLSLTTGQTGTVFLEVFNDSGCTTGTQELGRAVNGNGGTLTIGLALTQNVTGAVGGIVPAGKYVKIRTANTVGTPTFTYRSGQEVTI